MAKLIVYRLRQYADMLRSYAILVDGKPVATIRRGQTIEVELPSGRHRITSMIDWARSNPVELEARSEGVYHLEVGSNLRAWRLLLAILYVTVWRDRYLYLKIVDQFDGGT
jgi:hypothetical protein